MVVEDIDRRLLAAIQDGLPLVPRPYTAVGERLGLSEAEVIARLGALLDRGVVKRLGLIVRHRELGYRANAMVVWDVPAAAVDELGARMAAFPFVTLCYRRSRRPPDWPYNLFCMIHGRERRTVLAQLDAMVRALGIAELPRAVLFSRRRFKQRGAVYAAGPAEAA